ncbi:hypothetical protein [Hungatella hathewayi]|uniref:hypothetical protein n=1 Tax=Hungatella hathewayi TaxID=154046 RepID=UPI003568B51D
MWVRSDLSLRESTAECRIYYATCTDMSEEEVHLAELIHSVVSMVQPLVDEKQQQFQIHLNDIEHI